MFEKRSIINNFKSISDQTSKWLLDNPSNIKYPSWINNWPYDTYSIFQKIKKCQKQYHIQKHMFINFSDKLLKRKPAKVLEVSPATMFPERATTLNPSATLSTLSPWVSKTISSFWRPLGK